MVLLRDIVDRDVISLTPDMSIVDARRLLARRRAGIAPVLSHGRVLGVIAAHELLLPVCDHLGIPLTSARARCPRGPVAWLIDNGGMLSVGDLPLHDGHLFPLETELGRAAHYVWRTGTEYLLLLQQGRLAGIVSATRIIAAVSRSEFRTMDVR